MSYANRLIWFVLLSGTALAGCDTATDSDTAAPEPLAPPLLPEPPAAAEPPDSYRIRFADVAGHWGVAFQRHDDFRGRHRILEANGGGVAVFDYDADGQPDLCFVNGCRLPLKERRGEHFHQLFRNELPGSFRTTTEQAGLLHESYGQGVATGDFDGDGFDDLYLTAFGENRLWHNNGDGTFTDVTAAAGVACPSWSSSAAFADLNADGLLDLYVAGYIVEDDEDPKLCPRSESPDGFIQCSPNLFDACADTLLLNNGRGSFLDVTSTAGITAHDGKGLGVAIFDADRNGFVDVFVANDGTPNFLYLNQGVAPVGDADEVVLPKFQEMAGAYGVAVNVHGMAQASMGIACGDVGGDGRTDICLTHFAGDTNTLYEQSDNTGFQDSTSSSGLGPASRPMLGWGTEFLDADNDGQLELVITNGHVDDRRWTGLEPYAMRPQFFVRSAGGRFNDVGRWTGSYFTREWVGRGLATGDLDGDGRQDIVISHQIDDCAVLRNETPSPQARIELRLIGRGGSNRSGFGTIVTARGDGWTQTRERHSGGSFLSASSTALHIGLNDTDTLPLLQIDWPDGTTDRWENVAAGRVNAVQQQGLYH